MDSEQAHATNDTLLERAKKGDEGALAELFEVHRGRLARMVALRLDGRLQGRVDVSDVLQEAFLDLAAKLPDFEAKSERLDFFLWMRLVTSERLLQVHRRHLGAAKRDAAQEIPLCGRPTPAAQSITISRKLASEMTSPTQGAQRAELQAKLQEVLNAMQPIDREILVLRHFEELSNDEAARVLGLKKAAASNRYVRALARLREVLAGQPDLSGSF